MAVRLIALDLDGTLLSRNNEVTPATREAIAAGDKAAADAAYKTAVKAVDQAVNKGLLHKNNAARKKSSMTLKLNKLA